jgi:hypothetical protein
MTLAATTTRVLTRGQLRDCVDLPVLTEELRQALIGYDEDAGVAHRLRSNTCSVTASEARGSKTEAQVERLDEGWSRRSAPVGTGADGRVSPTVSPVLAALQSWWRAS